MFLGLQAEFEDHGQCRDSGTGTLGSMSSKPNRSEGGFDGVGGPYMRPMLGREVVKGEQHFFIFRQAFAGFWKFVLVTGDELIIGCQSYFAGRR